MAGCDKVLDSNRDASGAPRFRTSSWVAFAYRATNRPPAIRRPRTPALMQLRFFHLIEMKEVLLNVIHQVSIERVQPRLRLLCVFWLSTLSVFLDSLQVASIFRRPLQWVASNSTGTCPRERLRTSQNQMHVLPRARC